MTFIKKVDEMTNQVSYISDDSKIRLVRGWHNECKKTIYYIWIDGECIATKWSLKDAKAFAER